MTWNRLIVCRDENKAIQSICLYDSKDNYLDHLVTHPNNIQHPINDSCLQTRGAGKAIILYLAEQTEKNKFPKLTVYSIKRAVSFYEHLHFEKKSEVEDDLSTKLVLKAETIKSRIYPFDQISSFSQTND